MKSFSFEHVFRAPSVAVVFAAYFDPKHAIEQDRELGIVEREILEWEDTPEQLRRVCRVVPKRQLPALVRPLVNGQLHYVETAIWRKREDRIECEIRPSILAGRATISATYRLSPVSPGLIRRSYEGSVSVDVRLISARIERGIVAEFERSMPLAAACTQAFLDRVPSSVQAHA
ncbi:MAG: DUF2505 domain-containing protein [Myxococcota bacterium]|nr:DUF2505 domain-containing protein [Myxococcota bacterium]